MKLKAGIVLFFILVCTTSAGALELGPFDLTGVVKLGVFNIKGEHTVGYHSERTGHARYLLGGEFRLAIRGTGFFGQFNPMSYWGRNLPQRMYTWDAPHIATKWEWGGGYRWKILELIYLHREYTGDVRERRLSDRLEIRAYIK